LSHRLNDRSGQALLEFVFIATFMLILAFGLIDFARALIARQVLTNVTREGANLASRGTSMTNAMQAVITSASPLNLNQTGCVILSSVYRDTLGRAKVTAQCKQGGLAANSAVGAVGATAVLPDPALLANNDTMIVAEVFYHFVPVTPLGKMLKITLPSTLYDVAYF
jgi:Flp pilus assembly protein TadG